MRKAGEFWAGVLFLLIGIGMIIMFSKVYTVKKEFMRTAVPVEAYISEIIKIKGSDDDDVTYRVYADYSVDNTAYSQQLDYYDGNMREGDTVNIYYNPYNPSEISVGTQNLTLMFVSAALMSLGFIIVGIRTTLPFWAFIVYLVYHKNKEKH